MKSAMETIKEAIEFISSYELWAKVTMLVLVILFLCVLVLAPRGKKKIDVPEKFASLFQDDKFAVEDLRSFLRHNSDALIEHLTSEAYDKIYIINKFKVDNATFDLVVYYHNDEMNQMGRRLMLIQLYDIRTQGVDWKKIDDDWKLVNENITWQKLKSTLEATNGFRYALERSTPLGLEKPGVTYLQICGRREKLNQNDLALMQNSIVRNDEASLWRAVITYDFLLQRAAPYF